MEAKTQYHPIDFDSLHKGQVIPVEVLEEALGIKSNKEQYPLKLLGLKDQIKKHMRSIGSPLTVKVRKKELHILMDAQATEYNFNWQKRRLRSSIEFHRQLLEVDSKNLTADEKRIHERRMLVSSRYAQAIRQTSKQIRVESEVKKISSNNDSQKELSAPD